MSRRPFKSVRVVYSAEVRGGSLGTLEVGGTTDRAEWMPLGQVSQEGTRADIVDVGVDAWCRR